MADSIKGLSMKIGADTSDFVKGLKRVDKEIKTTSKQAEELQKGLEIQFDEKRFVEAQRLIQNSLQETQEKARLIREELKFLEDSGAVDTDGYKKLQTELYKTENQALLLQKRFEDLNNTNKKSVGSMITNIKGLVTNMNPAIAGTVALAGATYKLVNDTRKQADEISTLATKYDQSTEAIQRWNYIAMQSDVDSNVLYKSMKKLNSAFGEQSAGEINQSTEALAELGINIKNFENTEDAFTATIQKISSLKDVTQQTYYANKIFGENVASELIPLFQQGSEAIATYNAEFEQSGALTDSQIQDLAEFDNMMNKITARIKNIVLQLGSKLMPIVKTVFNFIEKTILPMLDLLFQILDPIIKAVDWLLDKMSKVSNFVLGIFGKGWLWGIEDNTSKATASPTTTTSKGFNDTINDYSIPNNISNSNIYNEDNSSYNIDMTINSNGSLEYDARELANEVIRQISLKQQAGR